MALIKRLSMRRQIRRTAERSLAQNPIFTGPAPATPLYHSAPPEVNIARLSTDNPDQPPASAAGHAPEATTAEGSRPPVPAEPGPPSSVSSVETGSGDAGQPAPRVPKRPSPPPAPDTQQEEWQLPQWQYTSKRARTNQHQEQRKKRR
ncbi:hypothetical protein [Mycobacterium adipatum]|uniref:hypothetical protein n=1 Tax=Mycobacterium adipatum TaxID=1682113 RepID=UPI0012E9789A|nr:hypothetical protein [Mycobacterium adipatum]